MPISTWQKTRKRHLALIRSVDCEPLPKKLHITDNSKTEFSVDFPPHTTCVPTPVCMGAAEESAPCYALGGFMTYPNAVKHHARNQRLVDYLEHAPYTEVIRVAEALWCELPRGQTWLRWNGAGDLTRGAVRLINTFTKNYQEIRLWVISRRPELVHHLTDRACLKVLLSLDHSTPPSVEAKMRDVHQWFELAKIRLAYTRVSEDDKVPKGIYVVFNKHNGGWFNDWTHPKTCPATLSDERHRGACGVCRRCFR